MISIISRKNFITQSSTHIHTSGSTSKSFAIRNFRNDCKIIDGKAIATHIELDIKEKVSSLKTKYGIIPQIGVILVGDNRSSHTYVKLKKIAAERSGNLSILRSP
jgi:hypothetical protein